MKKIIFSIGMLAMALCSAAQQVEPLQKDPAIRFGQLDNGLTYYIRHNEQPKQRCDFHIAQAVGAILEEDNQNGLAHFLEHMAFNGTEHFPGKGIINYFESIGVNFGGNINAYTSLDETVYRLSDVPTIREGIIDSALLVLHDWACGLSLIPEEIDAERGVIREEWRTRSDVTRRMWAESQRQMYPGSQYAKRDIIGDTAIINNFEYDALRAYYKKWYGPDNQAIIVVGDIDVDQIEQKIKALWANVPARTNRGERPLYSVDDNDAPIVAIITDKEAQQTRIRLEYKHAALPKAIQNSTSGYAVSLMHNLIRGMMGTRFSDLMVDPDACFVGAMAAYSNLVKEKDAFDAIVVPKEGRETEAYQFLLTQVEKMRRYGFTNAELERAKAEMLSSYEKSYNERDTRRNISLAQEYIRNYEDGEPIPGIEWEYNFVKQVLPVLTVDQINKVAASYVSDKNMIVCITGPEKQGVNIPTKEQVLKMLADMKDVEIEAPKEEEINTTLVKKLPKMGKIKKAVTNQELGTTEWTLKNGVKVIFKPTEFKKDEIQMTAFSQGGYSLVDEQDLPSAHMADAIVQFSGLGDFSMTELSKALTGKNVSASTSISEYSENVNGTSSVKDFETMLQLVYLGFTAPRRDEKAFQTLMNLLENQLANKEKNHKAIWQDSIALMASNYSPRTILMNTDMLKKVNLDKALEIYKQRFANPADFTFIFVGNINPEDATTKQLICQYLGGMKGKKKTETFKDYENRIPDKIQKNYFSRDMQITAASNRIQYTSYDMPYSLATELNLKMIGRILATRYLESIREREGGSYGVGCAGGMKIRPVSTATLIMQFDTDPLKQEKLMNIIHEEVQTIVKNGPLANDLDKEKKSMLKDYQENIEKNAWWKSSLMLYYMYGINNVRDYQNEVNAITAETVQATLKKLCQSGNIFEVVMFPAK